MRHEHITTHTYGIRSQDGARVASERLFRELKAFEPKGYRLVAFQVLPDGTVMVLQREVTKELLRIAHLNASCAALKEVGDATGKDKEKHFEFLRAYRRNIQEAVVEEMKKEGKTRDDIDDFWGNEMPT
jgi:hypothetical protein